MSRLATIEDFEQGGLYTQYRDYPFFNERAQNIITRYGAGRTILVVGCGWGYLVKWLLDLDISAQPYGIDASQYAITKAAQVNPTIASRLRVGNATVAADMEAMRTLAGLRGKNKFFAAVSEDLLPVCSDAEAQAVAAQMRAVATNVFHIITTTHLQDVQRDPTLNWKTQTGWRALLGTDICWDAEAQVQF